MLTYVNNNFVLNNWFLFRLATDSNIVNTVSQSVNQSAYIDDKR